MAEQQFIVGELGPADGTLKEYYIGGVFDGGAWTWVTGEPFVFSFWGAGEPNGNASEPRIALDARHIDWGWNDFTGAGAAFVLGFVAERHVPEPATLALLGVALAGLGFARRRKLH